MPDLTPDEIDIVRCNIRLDPDRGLVWVERTGPSTGRWNALYGGKPVRVVDPGDSRPVNLQPIGLWHYREADIVAALQPETEAV